MRTKILAVLILAGCASQQQALRQGAQVVNVNAQDGRLVGQLDARTGEVIPIGGSRVEDITLLLLHDLQTQVAVNQQLQQICMGKKLPEKRTELKKPEVKEFSKKEKRDEQPSEKK